MELWNYTCAKGSFAGASESYGLDYADSQGSPVASAFADGATSTSAEVNGGHLCASRHPSSRVQAASLVLVAFLFRCSFREPSRLTWWRLSRSRKSGKSGMLATALSQWIRNWHSSFVSKTLRKSVHMCTTLLLPVLTRLTLPTPQQLPQPAMSSSMLVAHLFGNLVSKPILPKRRSKVQPPRTLSFHQK